jgi:RNA polymerase sigma-70 factor (ECF subfamily)
MLIELAKCGFCWSSCDIDGVCSLHPEAWIQSMDSPTARPLLNDLAPLDELRESEENAVGASASSGSTMLNRIKYQLIADEELVAKLKAGEAEALTVLFERHSSLVFRVARRILHDDAEAEDAVQQVFLDIFRSVAKFDPAKGTFKVWLLMFAYNRSLNRRRGLQAAHFYDVEDLEEVLRSHAIAEKKPSIPFRGIEAAYLVREALSHIQPHQREVIELAYYEGCTAEEIAVRTGSTAAIVRHNLYRGLEKARSILKRVSRSKDTSQTKHGAK